MGEAAAPALLGPQPLVLGVTGHRDLRAADHEALEAGLRAIFTDLRGRYPATPLTLLSSLAEGADRLAARVALAVGVRLVVPLPLPETLYRADFATVESRAEYAALRERASDCFVLPLVGNYPLEAVSAPGPARDAQYYHAGAFIARRCHILIALWDGEPAKGLGGTAQIVQLKLEGIPGPDASRRPPLGPSEPGPVYQIVTPRAGNPRPAGGAFTLHRRFPATYGSAAEAQAAFEQVYARIDDFNREALRGAPRG